MHDVWCMYLLSWSLTQRYVCMMNIFMILDACMPDVCMHDACIHNAYLYAPWSRCMCVSCMNERYTYLWSLTLMRVSMMRYFSVTDQRTNEQGDSRSRIDWRPGTRRVPLWFARSCDSKGKGCFCPRAGKTRIFKTEFGGQKEGAVATIVVKPSRLPGYLFCICLSTNKYQKYKSVELGDQLHRLNQPPDLVKSVATSDPRLVAISIGWTACDYSHQNLSGLPLLWQDHSLCSFQEPK